MRKTSEKLCLSCEYGKTFPLHGKYCDRLLMTGETRNCPVGKCDKYKPKAKGKCKKTWLYY